MRDQHGFTILELLAFCAITIVLSGMAYLGAVNYAISARTSKVSSGIANSIAVARSLAIAKSQQTQLRFHTDTDGMTHSYSLWSLCLSKWDTTCNGTWKHESSFEQKETDPDTGVDQLPRGAAIRFPGKSGEITITFDPSGRRGTADNVDLEVDVCSVLKSGAGETCHPSHIRRLCINKGGGLIKLLKEGGTCP